VAPSVNRLSNANIEGYFNIIKKYVLNNEVNLKVGRFITRMKNYTSQLCNEIKLNIPMRRNKRDIRQCNEQNKNDPLIEETWQKKKALYSYFEGWSLGRISKKHKFETSTPISHEKSNTNNLSKLNLSESSTHVNALNNGLFFDVEYYMNSPDPILTIGIYGSIASVISNDDYTLIAEEFCTLRNSNWIGGKIIDCFTINLLNSISDNFIYIPTNHSYLLAGDSYKKPKDSHWPSLRDKAGKDICDRKWQEIISDDSRPLQNDSFNCGVYIMYYLECTIREIPYDRSFNPTKYNRTTIAETLLTSSRCMQDVCKYCFSDRKLPLVMCNTCRRW
ncbi:hypothetical protein PV325_013890, partial [Microctonus aethiopoides]